MDQASVRTASIRYWLAWARKQALLCSLSIAIAAIVMVRVKGGWWIEPLTWLSLVWYLILLFISDFVIFRGRGRIATLFLLTVGVAIAIMFPFTAIRKANYRARFRPNVIGASTNVKLNSNWNWWEVAPNELLPRCLAWRMPVRGIGEYGEFVCSGNELLAAKHPDWFLKEVFSFQYIVPNDEPPPDKLSLIANQSKLQPGTAYIRLSDDRQKRSSGSSRPVLDWLLNCVDFGTCYTIDISDVDFSKDAWLGVLASRNLGSLRIVDSNVDGAFIHSLARQDELSEISMVRVPNIAPNDVIEILSRCEHVQDLGLSHELLQDAVVRKIYFESKIFSLRICGNQDRLELNTIIPRTSPRQIHIENFAEIDFTDEAIRSIFDAHEAVYFENCRFSVEDLIELSNLAAKSLVLVQRCKMSQTEFQKLDGMANLPDGATELSETGANWSLIRNWLKDPYQISIEGE